MAIILRCINIPHLLYLFLPLNSTDIRFRKFPHLQFHNENKRISKSFQFLALPSPSPPPPSIPHLLAPAPFIPFLLLRGAVSPPTQGLTSHSACISSLSSLLTDLLQPIRRSLWAPMSGPFPFSPTCLFRLWPKAFASFFRCCDL